MAAVAAAAMCQRQRLRWLQHWQHGNKVNKYSDNNMTTTQQTSRQSTRQIEQRERNYVFFQCAGMS
jgi:hypothetical protein